MTPNSTTNGYKAPESLKTQKSQMDLDTFETVTLVKEAPFTPVASAEELMARLNGSTSKFLEVANRGLYAIEQAAVRANDGIPWHIINEDGTTGPDYTGTVADPAIVNPLVLNLAKSAFGYLNAKNADEKRAAKEMAINVIKSTPAILNGIKAQAKAAAAAEDTE